MGGIGFPRSKVGVCAMHSVTHEQCELNNLISSGSSGTGGSMDAFASVSPVARWRGCCVARAHGLNFIHSPGYASYIPWFLQRRHLTPRDSLPLSPPKAAEKARLTRIVEVVTRMRRGLPAVPSSCPIQQQIRNMCLAKQLHIAQRLHPPSLVHA